MFFATFCSVWLSIADEDAGHMCYSVSRRVDIERRLPPALISATFSSSSSSSSAGGKPSADRNFGTTLVFLRTPVAETHTPFGVTVSCFVERNMTITAAEAETFLLLKSSPIREKSYSAKEERTA